MSEVTLCRRLPYLLRMRRVLRVALVSRVRAEVMLMLVTRVRMGVMLMLDGGDADAVG